LQQNTKYNVWTIKQSLQNKKDSVSQEQIIIVRRQVCHQLTRLLVDITAFRSWAADGGEYSAKSHNVSLIL
jgi:hypothetical protein